MLRAIDLVDGCDINDEIFVQLMQVPDTEAQAHYELSLAHKALSESQLHELCARGTWFECFFELAILYYTKAYPLEKLQDFVEMFHKSKYAYLREELLGELKNCWEASSEEKRAYVENWI